MRVLPLYLSTYEIAIDLYRWYWREKFKDVRGRRESYFRLTQSFRVLQEVVNGSRTKRSEWRFGTSRGGDQRILISERRLSYGTGRGTETGTPEHGPFEKSRVYCTVEEESRGAGRMRKPTWRWVTESPGVLCQTFPFGGSGPTSPRKEQKLISFFYFSVDLLTYLGLRYMTELKNSKRKGWE